MNSAKVHVLRHGTSLTDLIKSAFLTQLSFFDFTRQDIDDFVAKNHFVTTLVDFQPMNEKVTLIVSDRNYEDLADNLSLLKIEITYRREMKLPDDLEKKYAYFAPVVSISTIEDTEIYSPLVYGILTNFNFPEDQVKTLSPFLIKDLSAFLKTRQRVNAGNKFIVEDFYFLLNPTPVLSNSTIIDL